jgi:hypothetical protein
MDESQAQVVSALREFVAANRAAREAMEQGEAVVMMGIEEIERGGSVVDALRAAPASDQRLSTKRTLERLSVARHKVRLLLVAECTSDGMVGREIADLWGFSRQRAAKFVLESREVETSRLPN